MRVKLDEKHARSYGGGITPAHAGKTGKESLGVVVDGSDLLTIPAGERELEVYFSSWIKSAPEVTVEFEERWL